MINLTDAAVAALENFLGPGTVQRENHPLRVAIERYSETGYSYFFGFADDPNEHYQIDTKRDVVEVVKGFPVAVRRDQVQYLTGTTIDYVESRTEGAGFKFDNPRGELDTLMSSAH